MRDEVERVRHWKRVEYDRLIEMGFFGEDEAIELLGGRLIVAEPQGSRHFTAIQLVTDALRLAFGPRWQVRVQGPVALDDESEPEPDLAIVPGTARDYLAAHPARPVLVVEVAESSLALDRRQKGSLYARAGLADYWIVNLADEVLEVYRDPGLDSGAVFGWRYLSLISLARHQTVTPLAAPASAIRVADLLP